jgi:hypothetical protein
VPKELGLAGLGPETTLDTQKQLLLDEEYMGEDKMVRDLILNIKLTIFSRLRSCGRERRLCMHVSITKRLSSTTTLT